MEAANAHYHNGHQQPGPPLPASPTLTNPDMILPDYGRSDSPDPDLGDRGHSPLEMWKNAHAAAASAEMHRMFVATGLVQRIDHPYGPTGPLTPTTPIIYGNGTMLSDIGEVTEVESTVGKPSPSRSKFAARRPISPGHGGGSDGPLRSSPTVGPPSMMKKKSKQSLHATRERRSSIESTSTIKTEDQARLFADFDDSVSVDDSVFQGDDEESLASSYVEGTAVIETARLGVAKADSIDRLSTYSTTSLSRRAEEILANAKKRLTTMEGNLSRARTSLHYGTAYGSDESTPSPPFQRAATVMHSRDGTAGSGTSTPELSPRHSRMGSDVAIRNGLPYRVTMPRSQSALGAAGGYRQPLVASKSADQLRGQMDEEPGRSTFKLNPARETSLQPLTEDEVARLGEADSMSQHARLEAFLSPTFGSFDNGSNSRRSASSAQMRDIKDQMKDLKGKISSLREQARADSLKRHSMQSLRTPSPFTHAQIDQWYARPRSNRTSEISTSTVTGRNPWNGEESSVDGDSKEQVDQLDRDDAAEEDVAYINGNGVQPEQAASHSPEAEPLSPGDQEVSSKADEDDADLLTENGDVDGEQEDDFQDADDLDYQSESGESLYHDTVQHQISHEDREDAFDYEHFFLHSAMGTMSQQRLARRGSLDSYTSEDSVETTRGPVLNVDHSPDRSHSITRRNSSDSISTIGTFATADEGRSRRSVESPDGASIRSHDTFESFPRASSSAQSTRHRSGSTATAKRLSLGVHPLVSAPLGATNATRDSDGSISPIAEEDTTAAEASQQQPRRNSVIHRPFSIHSASRSSLHRPSVSSFESVGTNRSFPLVNKPAASAKANSTGILTPRDSPDQELRHISSTLLSETVSSFEQQQLKQRQPQQPDTDEAETSKAAGAGGVVDGGDGDAGSAQPHPLQSLLREDKYLVERIVAGLGRCVLGLTENGRASAESRMFRRRIDAARRILEGLDDV